MITDMYFSLLALIDASVILFIPYALPRCIYDRLLVLTLTSTMLAASQFRL